MCKPWVIFSLPRCSDRAMVAAHCSGRSPRPRRSPSVDKASADPLPSPWLLLSLPSPSLSSCFSREQTPNPSHGAREDSRRLRPPLINRLDRKVRLGVLYRRAEPSLGGSCQSPPSTILPQPHRAVSVSDSGDIEPPPTSPTLQLASW